jgi:Protein of unknown function (DUF2950)
MRNVKIGAAFVLLIALYAQLCAAQQAPGAGFASAEDASRALYEAVRINDQTALARILGADNQFVSGDDPAQERREREQFATKFDEMHRLVREPDGTSVLYVGAENWPFPFPLTQDGEGWHFDAKAGMEEVLARRIGEDELAAIDTARALATQKEETPQAGGLLVNVGNDGREVPFYGYYFRTLPGQLTVVAYPAQYRVTGVKTFVAGADNVVFEKDLGPRTAEVARTMERLDSPSTWQRIE